MAIQDVMMSLVVVSSSFIMVVAIVELVTGDLEVVLVTVVLPLLFGIVVVLD